MVLPWCLTMRHDVPVSDDYERLARAIVAAREAKGMSQDDLIRESGLGRSTIQRLERGEGRAKPGRQTRQVLERVLSWGEGSVLLILAGGDPTPGPDVERYTREPMSDVNELIRDIVWDAAAVFAPDTPMSEVQKVIDRARKIAHSRGFAAGQPGQTREETERNDAG